MRCLVTGASGYLGRSLVPALVAAQCQVRAVVHRSGPVEAAQETIAADLAAGPGDDACSDVDTVFHLAGLAHRRAGAADYRAVNVEATRRLATLAAGAGVRRFIFVSSVKAALAEGASEYADDYAVSKAQAEAALREIAANYPMDVIIVRPALVYGGQAHASLGWLERWVQAHLPRPPAGGARSMVARADLVRVLLGLRSAGLVSPATVTVTDGETYSARRLHRALCAARGREPWLPSPPRWVWRSAARAADALSRQRPGSTWQRLQGEECYPASDLEALLGFTPEMTFEEALGLPGREAC